MGTNGTSNTLNTRAQPSIRSFFQPRQPSYTAPPLPLSSRSDIPVPTTTSTRLPPESPPQPSQTPPSNPSKTKSIPEGADVSLPTQPHIQPLRRINALLLPISYPDSFYNNILSHEPAISFSRVITWKDPAPLAEAKVVGGIVCRLDPAMAPDSTPSAPTYLEGFYDIYIQSLALLSPYRGHGLAAAALQEVVDAATSQQEVRIASLYAHVWTENEEALGWYESRRFTKEGPVLNGYYRRLKPDTAWIFRRRIVVGDHLASVPTTHAVLNPTSAPASTTDLPQRPPPLASARSSQERGPEREWNDLPEDVLGNALLRPSSHLTSRDGSTTSSRSSSRSGLDGREKGKKKRVYPAAAFGGGS